MGSTLLGALESNEAPAVAAYRAGICGCCETRMINSNHAVSSTTTLIDAEIAGGCVLVCPCHSQGDSMLT